MTHFFDDARTLYDCFQRGKRESSESPGCGPGGGQLSVVLSMLLDLIPEGCGCLEVTEE